MTPIGFQIPIYSSNYAAKIQIILSFGNTYSLSTFATNKLWLQWAAPLLFLQSEKFRLTLPIKVKCLTIKPREAGDLWLRLDNIQLPY